MDAILAGLMVPDVQNHSLAALIGAARAAGFAARAIPFNRPGDIDRHPSYANTTQTLVSAHLWIA